jgi:hypothetical protein
MDLSGWSSKRALARLVNPNWMNKLSAWTWMVWCPNSPNEPEQPVRQVLIDAVSGRITIRDDRRGSS